MINLIKVCKYKLYTSHGNTSVNRVGGVKVSIVAFQAIDPGSIPGSRILFKISSSRLWGVSDDKEENVLRLSHQPYTTKYSHVVSSHYTE